MLGPLSCFGAEWSTRRSAQGGWNVALMMLWMCGRIQHVCLWTSVVRVSIVFAGWRHCYCLDGRCERSYGGDLLLMLDCVLLILVCCPFVGLFLDVSCGDFC